MDYRGGCAPLSMIIALGEVRWTGALPLEIYFSRTVCVHNALADVLGGTVVNCAVVRMEGGIAEVDMLHF